VIKRQPEIQIVAWHKFNAAFGPGAIMFPVATNAHQCNARHRMHGMSNHGSIFLSPPPAHRCDHINAQRQKEDLSSGCPIAGRIVSPPLLYTLDQLSQTDWYCQIGSSVGVIIGRRHG